jgi:hypothetical protein
MMKMNLEITHCKCCGKQVTPTKAENICNCAWCGKLKTFAEIFRTVDFKK